MADNAGLDLEALISRQPPETEGADPKLDLSEILRVQSRDGNGDVDRKGLDEQLKLSRKARYEADTKARDWLAKWTAITVSVWLAMVLVVLFSNTVIKLSDSVLIALIGTTTLNVLGLPYIVLRGHFSERKDSDG